MEHQKQKSSTKTHCHSIWVHPPKKKTKHLTNNFTLVNGMEWFNLDYLGQGSARIPIGELAALPNPPAGGREVAAPSPRTFFPFASFGTFPFWNQ